MRTTWVLMSLLAACGNNTNDVDSGMMFDQGVADLAAPLPDMTRHTIPCRYFWENSMPPDGRANQLTKDRYNAVTNCLATVCGGGPGSTDAGGTPCADSSSAACQTCFNNALVGSLEAPMNQDMLIACQPSPAEPSCQACKLPVDDCIADCTTDADCAGFHCANTSLTLSCQPDGVGFQCYCI